MGRRRLTATVLAASAAALALVAPASAASELRPPITWLRGEGNYTKAHRPPQAIRKIVVHVTEGSFAGSTQWLRNHRAHASAHFIVGRDGSIVQLVHQSDIAWHAGNPRVNRESIGIEHEGMTYDPAGFTAAEVDASARLAAWIARRSLMPIDRRHIIGHAEVPGADHTDPGPYWSWRRYLRLVRRYAALAQPLRVRTTTVRPGERIDGIVPWRATATPNVRHVEFLLNGRVLWRDRVRPFAFAGGRGLNTVALDNGRHVLGVRAVGPFGRTKVSFTPVVVWNRRFALTTAGARPWSLVRPSVVRVRARVWAARAETVSFRVDGRRLALDRRPPYVFRWDARKARPGKHLLELVARAVDGRRVRRRIPIVVGAPRPAALRVVAVTPAAGATLTSFVVARAEVQGRPQRVELWIDGVRRGVDVRRPFTFGWDAPADAPGEHRLELRAVAGARVAAKTVTVTVAPPLEAAAP